MAFSIGLYLLVDILHHKGQTRILFPKTFPAGQIKTEKPPGANGFIINEKAWKKGINSREQLNALSGSTPGFEIDVYFDSASHVFDVHHDPGKSSELSLGELLAIYQQRKLDAGIWLDIKNLDEMNASTVLRSLIALRNSFKLHDKLLVESHRADLLTAFTDSGFFSSYYVPMFNPYKLNHEQVKAWADQIAAVLNKSRINALSGYYFQYPFLHQYFPAYPVLTWADKSRFSLVNQLFRNKIRRDQAVLICLYP